MLPRVVVDTNVFIGAILGADGNNRQVIRMCLSGEAKPLMGAALFHEYEDLLSRESLMDKSPLGKAERRALLSAFLSVSEWIRIYFLWRPNLPDEGDNHLVELALAGSAGRIITNNTKDLIHGQLRFPGLQIQTPKQFIKSLP